MGPFSLEQQLKRMESVDTLLSRTDLSEEAVQLWTRVRNNIALDEDTYNARVMWAYRNHKQEIIQWRIP